MSANDDLNFLNGAQNVDEEIIVNYKDCFVLSEEPVEFLNIVHSNNVSSNNTINHDILQKENDSSENKLKGLLKEWNLEQVFEELSGSGVTYDRLKYLNRDDLENIFPGRENTGLKAEIRERIFSWRIKKYPNEIPSTLSCNSYVSNWLKDSVFSSGFNQPYDRSSGNTPTSTNSLPAANNSCVADILHSSNAGKGLISFYGHNNRKKSQMENDCIEYSEYLRTEDNYNDGLKINDVKQSGIKTHCLLNDFSTFHVTKNFVVDIVHDLFEGVCRYDLCEILLYFISELKLFSLDVFNYRKQMFNYGETELGNLSPPIDIMHLKTNKIKMSAREMMTFTHFLLIGDLIPIENEVWKFFLTLLKIIDLVLLSRFDSILLEKLAKLIEIHNRS